MRALLAVVTKVELFINLKAAKILGLSFRPRSSAAPTRIDVSESARRFGTPMKTMCTVT